MKKTYWWRVLILLFSLILFVFSFVLNNQEKFGTCKNTYSFGSSIGCLDKSAEVGDPLYFFSIALFVCSLSLFFVSDIVFIKWLRFAVIWTILTIVLIAISPTYTGGWMSFGPTKELVSIWMGILFFVISITILVAGSKKQKTLQ